MMNKTLLLMAVLISTGGQATAVRSSTPNTYRQLATIEANSAGRSSVEQAEEEKSVEGRTPPRPLVAMSIGYLIGTVLALLGAATMSAGRGKDLVPDRLGVALAGIGFALQMLAVLAYLPAVLC